MFLEILCVSTTQTNHIYIINIFSYIEITNHNIIIIIYKYEPGNWLKIPMYSPCMFIHVRTMPSLRSSHKIEKFKLSLVHSWQR